MVLFYPVSLKITKYIFNMTYFKISTITNINIKLQVSKSSYDDNRIRKGKSNITTSMLFKM